MKQERQVSKTSGMFSQCASSDHFIVAFLFETF